MNYETEKKNYKKFESKAIARLNSADKLRTILARQEKSTVITRYDTCLPSFIIIRDGISNSELEM